MTEKPKGSLISYFSRMVARGGGINLAQGKPGFAPPPELLDILIEKTGEPALHQYAPGLGNFQLLDLIQGYYSNFTPLEIDNLLVVQGATEGLSLSFLYLSRLLEKPYSVLSFDPVYESYPRLPEIFGIPFEYFDLGEDLEIDFSLLEKRIREKRVKIVFIASPGNPLGKVWSPGEIEKIMELSRCLDFFVIFDAVYKDIYFDTPPANPLASMGDTLFYVDSFSKMLSITGWRIGFIITGKAHMAAIRDIHDYTGLSAPSLLQAAVAEYLGQQDFGSGYTAEIRAKARTAYLYMRQALEDLGFTVPAIQGGYFLWAGLPPGVEEAFQFALDLYRKVQVGLVPGENFSKKMTRYVRINIAHEMPVIREAVNKIREYF